MTHLEPGERVETDRGYRGSAPKYVKCPDGLLADPDPAVKLMAARVRSRQETVNERFKNWAILCTPYRHKFLEHQTVFGAIVVLTQLSLAANPLFHVEYNDKYIRLYYFTPSFHFLFYLFNVMTCWNTKQFLLLLLFSPSFLSRPTLCFRWHINY